MRKCGANAVFKRKLSKRSSKLQTLFSYCNYLSISKLCGGVSCPHSCTRQAYLIWVSLAFPSRLSAFPAWNFVHRFGIMLLAKSLTFFRRTAHLADSSSLMEGSVAGSIGKIKVFNSIVSLDSIFVMNHFGCTQWPSKMLLHYKSVLSCIIPFAVFVKNKHISLIRQSFTSLISRCSRWIIANKLRVAATTSRRVFLFGKTLTAAIRTVHNQVYPMSILGQTQ